jgi:Tol biopolymer transport system component
MYSFPWRRTIVAAAASLTLVGCDGGTGPSSSALEVRINTTGRALDRDGYTVSVDGQGAVAAQNRDTVTIADVSAGTRTVSIGGVAANCQVSGGSSRDVQLTRGRRTVVEFVAQCASTQLAYTTGPTGNVSLMRRRLDGTANTQVVTNIISSRMDWSPDGWKIAYTRPATDGSRTIWIVDVDSGTNRALAPATIVEAQHPVWSPDGARIAFTGRTGSGTVGIYTMRADGGDLRALTPDAANTESIPAWSPDGARILYRRTAGDLNEMWIMNADGTNPRALAPLGTNFYTHMEWSPDGSRIVFAAWRDITWDLYTIRPDGTGEVRLTSTATIHERYPTYLPDGRIAYIPSQQVAGELHDVWVMNADGTGAANFSNSPNVNELVVDWQ